MKDAKRFVLAASLGPADYTSGLCWSKAAAVYIGEATRKPDLIDGDDWIPTAEYYLEQVRRVLASVA